MLLLLLSDQRFQKLLSSLLLVQRSWVNWEAFNDEDRDGEAVEEMKQRCLQCYNNMLDVGGIVDWHGGNPKLHDLLHVHEMVRKFGAAESTSTGLSRSIAACPSDILSCLLSPGPSRCCFELLLQLVTALLPRLIYEP